MRNGSFIRTAVAAATLAVLTVGGITACRPVTVQHGAGTTPTPTATPRGHGPGSGKADRADAKPARPAATAKPKAPAAPALVMAAGATGQRVRELQARLRALSLFGRNPTGYYGPITAASVRSFQAGHGLARTGRVDTVTWAALRARTAQPSWSALYPPTSRPLGRLDPRCMTGRVLCISKSSRTLAWMVDGRVVSAMDVRFGSQFTPTREGTFRLYFKSRHHVSTIYHTAMPYALFFSGGQAVHYSADFAARGYNGASHGCVNVRDRGKIAALYAQTRVGDKVVVYR